MTCTKEDRVITFFIGLNDHFEVVESQVLLMEPLPNINKVISLMLQQEMQNGGFGNDNGEGICECNRLYEISRKMVKVETRPALIVVELTTMHKHDLGSMTFHLNQGKIHILIMQMVSKKMENHKKIILLTKTMVQRTNLFLHQNKSRV